MNRRERKKKETRANIIDCAVDMFKEKGFQETSMEEISEIADVSKGTLYNYFQNKESILVAYFQTNIVDYGKEFNVALNDIKGIQARLEYLLDFINKLLSNEKELATIYLKFRMQTFFDSDPFNNPQRSGLENFVLEIMKEAQENGEIRCDLPSLVLSRNFQFLTISYLFSNLYTEESLDMNHLRNQLIGLFLNGAKK